MTRCVVAAVDDDRFAEAVLGTASALGRLYVATVTAVHAGCDVGGDLRERARAAGVSLISADAPPVAALTAACSRPDVVALVLGSGGGLESQVAGETALAAIVTVDVPVVVVPAGWRAGEIVRVLVPLDGTQDTSAVLAETMRLAANGSPELVVLHVHTPTSVPAFADQSHHAQEAWDKEFLARFAPAEAEGARIVRRVGDPCVDVAAVAEEIDADVVVLGWSRRLDAGRGPVVRETLSRATVPVMLVPAP